MIRILGLVVAILGIFARGAASPAADEVIPHAQDRPPNPAYSPAEAMRRMKVPQGFTVELVASEPQIVNPVAMAFDERGRIWITESLEYPRHEPGLGRDRVKVLEDTDGDGRADRFTIFAEGLNIPSGIAVGHGGVWVANAPDILFLQDTDGDGRADRREVVVTGFGRDDTHELPNSLNWGPDGWLYGLNGVFNRSVVKHGGKEFDFTCALFRIHPKTRQFELFCEGTSNPWGVTWDGEGSAFVSACVIDHLWHLSETGYYFRQGGPYPPFTSIIGSIVDYKHQKAAYCGIHYFDSDAYPPQYREKLYMGNIHGNCVNVDALRRAGSTYRGTPEPDFLTANDAWFMPVSQKTGPDGCLYLLDWYDRYHCYQDANRDPQGIDRLKGRLYRVRYRDAPRAGRFDLAAESDDQLIARLASPNILFRELAQRLLVERGSAAARPKLEKLVLDERAPRKARMHALWALVGSGSLASDFHAALLGHSDNVLRAWGVRAAGNFREVESRLRARVAELASDPAADVRLQVAIAAGKLKGLDPLPVLVAVLRANGDDPLIPHIVWQNLHPLLEDRAEDYLRLVAGDGSQPAAAAAALMPKVVERILGRSSKDPRPIARLLAALVRGPSADAAGAQQCLAALAGKIQSREIAGERLAALRPELETTVAEILSGAADGPLAFDAAMLAAAWRDERGVAAARRALVAADAPLERRSRAIEALVAAEDSQLQGTVREVLGSDQTPGALRAAILAALGRTDQPWVAEVVLAGYAKLAPDVQPKAIELLTQRPAWAHRLLDAVGAQQVPTAAIGVNQVRKLLASNDRALVEKVRSRWGTLRTERNPGREKVIAQMRALLARTPGDAVKGQKVYEKLCGQCHKIYGQGQEVGPDITANGRASYEQLLSNVFDPSLVIGAAYQAQTVVTEDGRVLSGLVAEDSPRRIVLKVQGGKLETIAREDVAQSKTSQLSLMPEDVETQLKPEEIADLFAFLVLDKPPGDRSAKPIPGTPAKK